MRIKFNNFLIKNKPLFDIGDFMYTYFDSKSNIHNNKELIYIRIDDINLINNFVFFTEIGFFDIQRKETIEYINNNYNICSKPIWCDLL